jgi:hypothetical protein
MYFPKSQIKTNLYTKGRFLRNISTKEEYKGYYFETSSGKYYSGKTPQDLPVLELELIPNNSVEYTELTGKISPGVPQGDPIIDESSEADFSNLSFRKSSFFILPQSYISSTRINTDSSPNLPTQSYPTVTENDYKLGEIQRYFLKKGNESKFMEISLEEYRKYTSRDKEAMFELYTPIQINWVITGDKEQVYRTNKSIVSKIEQEKQLPGFTQYFRDRFNQFYK